MESPSRRILIRLHPRIPDRIVAFKSFSLIQEFPQGLIDNILKGLVRSIRICRYVIDQFG